MTQRIYLDYNATAPLHPSTLDVMKKIYGIPLNASSVHKFGREGRQAIETARTYVANLVGAKESQVIFNSGATEGNNTVLHHFKGQRVLVSNIEHPSVLEAAPWAEIIPVTKEGLVDLGALEAMLKKEPAALVSIMLANNETGIIQPVKEAAMIAKNHGALIHCDAVQAAGRIPVNMQELGVDFLTLSAHKIGGPQGIGALVLGICGITPVLLYGGGQEKSARAGTENIAGIAGFGEAAKLAQAQQKDFTAMRTKLENFLKENGAKVYGENLPRLSNTTFFSIQGIKAETALMALDLDGIAISGGSACTSGTVKPSHVLRAMHAPENETAAALRVSMGWDTKEEDIEGFIQSFSKFLNRTQKKQAHA